MSKIKEEEENKKIKDLLSSMSTEELGYTLGRYCGPHNVLLCQKTYGFVIPKKIVEEMLAHKSFEEIFLEDKK